MAQLNLKLYHDIQRRNIDATLLEYKTVKNQKGQDTRVFNCMSGEVKKLFDKIYENYAAAGLTKFEVNNEIISKCNLYKIDVENYLKGTVPIPAHHLFDILKTTKINLDGSLIEELHTSEGHGNTLILTRHLSPKFYININTEDWYDFEIVYQQRQDLPSAKTLMKCLTAMFRWYFKDKTPYTRQKLYDKIQEMYYTGKLKLEKRVKNTKV